MTDQGPDIESLFHEARQIRDHAEREAYLNQACAGNDALRVRLEKLLAAEEEVGSFLDMGGDDDGASTEETPRAGKATAGLPLTEKPGSVIGHYRLLQQIGEGGFGVVYLAEQDKPIHRKVALKIIKLGMDTKQVIARFETEREALALMNHPNVAKVFDAGATEQGRPYFVMEYVPGIPITHYCDKHELTTKERLNLFMDVCHAVQHAHQKGIIHRDIKPSNVLVAVLDEKAVPKIIDFGVARATEHRLAEHTCFTEEGQLVGTPAYMSPEQALGHVGDIDTRTDIYSLGVLLYELLVGARPFEDTVLRRAAFGEIQRIIREVDPPKPSTKLSGLRTEPRTVGRAAPDSLEAETRTLVRAEHPAGDTARLEARGADYRRGAIQEIARLRHTEPKTLMREIRGDLDWIVMKCLEKDRSRRYETPNALAVEIERHLRHEPVLAGPPSAVYRVGKFVRRNRGTVAAVSTIILALVVGLVGTSLMYLRASQARAAEEVQRLRAEKGEQAAKEEAERARQERDKAEKFGEFMAGILEGVGPSVALGRDTKMLKELMDAAVKRIEGGELSSVPEAEARLRVTIGSVCSGIGEYDTAEKMLISAVELAERVHGHESTEYAFALNEQAGCLDALGRWGEALPMHEEALVVWRRVFPGDHPDVAVGLNNLGRCLENLGRLADALAIHEEALAMRQRLYHGEDHEYMAGTLANMGSCLKSLGRVHEALLKYEEALAMTQRLFPGDHPIVANFLNDVGYALNSVGRTAEAVGKYEEALAMARRLFPPEHQYIALTLGNLGICLVELRRPDEALPKLEEALAMQQHNFPGDHPSVALALHQFAGCLRSMGRSAEALPKYEEALAMNQRLFPGDHPQVAMDLYNVALTLNMLGRTAEALPKYEEALAILQRIFPGNHPDVAMTLAQFAGCLRSMGRSAEALPKFEAVLAMYQRLFPGDHPNVAVGLHNVALTLHMLGRSAEALPKCEAALAMYRRILPAEHPDVLASQIVVGLVLSGTGRYQDAEPLLVESWGAIEHRSDVAPRHRQRCLEGLVKLYESWDAAEPGKGYDAKAAEWRATLDQWGQK